VGVCETFSRAEGAISRFRSAFEETAWDGGPVAECNYRWDAPNDEVTALFVGLCCWEWVAWRLQQGLRSTRDSAGAAAALHDVGTLQAVAKWDIYRDLRHYIQVCKQQPDYTTALGDVTLVQFTHYLFVLYSR
jgi:hypothetical protein